MCSRHEQLPHVIGTGPQWATTNVRQKATVVCDIRGSGRGNAGRFFSLPLTKCPRNVFLFTSCLSQNNNIWLSYYALVLDAKRWLDSRLDSVLDSGAEWPGFKSQSRRCRVTVLGKLFTLIVPLFTKQQNW